MVVVIRYNRCYIVIHGMWQADLLRKSVEFDAIEEWSACRSMSLDGRSDRRTATQEREQTPSDSPQVR